ncbi:hypothetical protein JHK87_031061 [Glycine soja]|nr:hypothetical protein JHK87_031061 [Glycine soja]
MVVVPFVPLAFLDDGSSPPPSPSSPPQKSFAKVLSNACDIPLRQLLVPCLKGDALSVKIPEDEYKARLEGCKNNLHGRLSLSKGDTLLNYQYLHIKLEKVCKPMGKWRMVPLGKDLPLVDRFGAETPELKDNPIVHQYFGIITSRWGYIVDDVSLCVDVNEGGLSLDGFTMVHSKSQRKKLHGNKKKMVVDSYPQKLGFLHHNLPSPSPPKKSFSLPHSSSTSPSSPTPISSATPTSTPSSSSDPSPLFLLPSPTPPFTANPAFTTSPPSPSLSSSLTPSATSQSTSPSPSLPTPGTSPTSSPSPPRWSTSSTWS